MLFVKKNNITKLIWLLVLWQLISVSLVAVGVWSPKIIFVTLGLSMFFIMLAAPFYTLLFLIISIPFYIAIPSAYFDGLPTWRVLFLWPFIVWGIKYWLQQFKNKNMFQSWKIFIPPPNTINLFSSWDKYLGLLGTIALLSLFIARFPVQGFKQIFFILNIYLLCVIVRGVAKTKNEILQIIYYTAASLGIIVLLGYIQFMVSLFVTPYYFWQYWASMISRIYYGDSLANVLTYSNSWFSYTGGEENLRMFSIMPDSHSFAMIAALFIAYLVPLTCLYAAQRCFHANIGRGISRKVYYGIWSLVRLSGLAVIFSGTRGIWVGLLAPFSIGVFLYIKNMGRSLVKPAIISFLMIIFFFIASPFINHTLNVIRLGALQENLLQRAASIYDLSEESNVGRLEIWQASLRHAMLHPLGTGYGNFIVSLVPNAASAVSYDDLAKQKNLRFNLPQKFISAHSLYLHILVELGLVGLLTLVLFIYQCIKQIWHFFKKYQAHNNIYTLFVSQMAFILIWFLTYSIFDVTIYNDRVLMYSFISLALTSVIMKNYPVLAKELECEQCKILK